MEEKHVFIAARSNTEGEVTQYEIDAPIEKARKRRKRKKQGRGLSVMALVLFSLSFAALCAAFIYLDSNGLIPEQYFRYIFMAFGGFILIESLFLIVSRKSGFVAVLSMLLCVAVIAVSGYGIYALELFYKSVEEMEDPKTYYAYVGVYVQKNSRFAPRWEEPEEGSKETEPVLVPGDSLDGCVIGTMLLNVDKGYTSRGINLFRKDNDVSVIPYEDFGGMIDALKNGEVDAVIYNKATMGLFLGNETDFYDWAVEADAIGIETENNVKVKTADVVSEPFIVYIAGQDTDNLDVFYDYTRSDANLIVCVDPVKKKVLIVNTPRDYYVPLWGEYYAMDKLTHAGVYGIDCSMETLESLYDIEFSYYVKTNIFSLVKVVDALGGITVHSDYEFYSWNQIGGDCQFYVGENTINGAEALCFIRERESFAEGDKQRGKNQMECIRAIIEKACSPAIVAHYSDVLAVAKESVRTNIGQEEINALIKMQLTDMASWSVESYTVDGYGSHETSYAMGANNGETYYVFVPDYDTVDVASEMMSEFMVD